MNTKNGTAAHSPLLTLSGVNMRFGPVQALRNVSLEFFPGEVLGLLGENGAGKSTLMRTLSGDYQPTEGQISMDGQPVSFRAPIDARRHGVHVVYQEPELAPDLTVAENLSLGALPHRRGFVSPRRVLSVARRLIADEGFGGTLDPTALVRDCSPAQRQCLEILKAVKGDVRLLCLDEPTSSLSEDESGRLWALMGRLRAAGTSIVYVSHRMAEIEQLCQRLVVMRDGQLISDQPTGAATEDEIIRLMVGRPLDRMFPSRGAPRRDRVVELRGVTTDRVRGIDLTVHAGEIVGLAGLVGAGRTELAEAIYGAVPLQAGEILVAGAAVRLDSPAAAIRAGIYLSPEDRKLSGLFPDRSVGDNVSISLLPRLSRLGIVRRRHERALIRQLVNRMRVKARSIDSPARTLSGGNQQKVLLSRGVSMRPKLLILDEPTRGIDVGAKAEVYHLVDELTREGMGVLMISSETAELIGLADRILVMRAGEVVGELAGPEATEEAVLRLAMGTTEEAA